jgi:ABC-2 type transport system permease protein
MTTETHSPAQIQSPTGREAPPADTARGREGIPMSRLVAVEMQKMFDTRSGFWLVTGGGIVALIATIATIAFAPTYALDYEQFASAIGAPLSIVLPMLGVLGVTSEWSQRTGLSTFTMVPRRGRVIAAKAGAIMLIGIASIALALVIGALGNLLGSGIRGVPTVWNLSPSRIALIFIADAIGMLMGFMLGVLIRNSPGAIVGYFVYALVLPATFAALAAYQHWFSQAQGWVNFRFSSTKLYDGHLTATDWAHLGVSGLIWLVLPLAIGIRMVMRSEVK